MDGALGEAYARGLKRLSLPPYDSPVYLRSDFSFETNRIFVNYSGDISGRRRRGRSCRQHSRDVFGSRALHRHASEREDGFELLHHGRAG